MALTDDYNYLVKLVLVGDSSVGKTSLLLRYADDVYNEAFLTTIGVDFKIRTREKDGLKIKQQLWDTAGQDRFKSIVASYYRGADGLAVVFDLTDMESFHNVQTWLEEADRYGCKDQCVKMIIGNKVDLVAKRVVTTEQAEELAKRLGLTYLETSAKTAYQVHQVFDQLTDDIVRVNKEGTLLEVPSGTYDLTVSSSAHRGAGWGCFGSDTCRLL